MGEATCAAAQRWYKPERSTQRTDPAKRSRFAMIPVGDNDTSSRPANDLGGILECTTVNSVSAFWGYDAMSRLQPVNRLVITHKL